MDVDALKAAIEWLSWFAVTVVAMGIVSLLVLAVAFLIVGFVQGVMRKRGDE